MTNGEAVQRCIAVLFLSAMVLMLLPFSVAEIKRVWNMTDETEPTLEMLRVHPGFTVIGWRNAADADGFTPADVLKVVANRMQYEQTTPLGSDANARALVKVLEAKAILEGRPTETADGIPIIE